MRKQTTKRRAAVVSRRALVCCVAFLAGAQVFSGGRAGAGTASGTTATGSDGGKTVSVGVSTSSSSPGVPGGATGVHGGSTGASCTYIPVPADADFVPGGPTPGQWYVVTCPGEQLELSDGGLVWIVTASHDVPVPDDSAPAALAERAAASISLPVPEIQLNPASFSVVRLQIFLAIAADIWHPFEATATSGGVTASAVATPVTVRWTMGDGGSVQCNGPGTPYQPDVPSDLQSTSCGYTYSESSAGQTDGGGGNDAAFDVTATVTWAVTWSAVGAPGGGTLPSLHTSASVPVRVEQVESVGVSP